MDHLSNGAGGTTEFGHNHHFLGPDHAQAERRSWAVIWLCGFMMVAEIGGGWLFGSIALIADGLHMSTHAGALLLAALAYTYARRHTEDPRFAWGTGKFGDLAGFTSAVALAMISLLIAYESVMRLFAPVPIRFAEAIPIAALGLAVNVASVWLLGGHHHGHDHEHDHSHDHGHAHAHGHAHGKIGQDNNMRAALVHVLADAAVSVLVIAGLLLARWKGWMWTDPAAGLVGAVVIASWAWTLVRDTGAILLDMNPDRGMAERVRETMERDGDRVSDLHLWRLGPGHLGAAMCVVTRNGSVPEDYRGRLERFRGLSHVTIEVRQGG